MLVWCDQVMHRCSLADIGIGTRYHVAVQGYMNDIMNEHALPCNEGEARLTVCNGTIVQAAVHEEVISSPSG